MEKVIYTTNLLRRCAIYARTATQIATHPESSFTSQIDACRMYAAKHGLRICDKEIYADHAVSGLPLKGARQLHQLLAASNDLPSFDLVLVTEVNRFGRTPGQVFSVIKYLREGGVKVLQTACHSSLRSRRSWSRRAGFGQL